jgi:hypothetical protein
MPASSIIEPAAATTTPAWMLRLTASGRSPRSRGPPDTPSQPSTMEWSTEGGDDAAHAYHRDVVDELLVAAR